MQRNESEELEIGKESGGVFSDLYPSSSLFSNFRTLKIDTQFEKEDSAGFLPNKRHSLTNLTIQIPPISSSPLNHATNQPTQIHQNQFHDEPISIDQSQSHTSLSTPIKRSIMAHSSSSLSHSPTLSSSLRNLQHPSLLTGSSLPSFSCCSSFITPFASKSLPFKFLTRLRSARLLRIHYPFLLIISPLTFYFFISYPRLSFFINFLFGLTFLLTILISLTLVQPRLPSIRLLLTRSFPTKLCQSFCATKAPPPVLWSIGSKPDPEKRATSGSGVKVYSNGDVYEGEFHKGKCSGSGVYHYHMSGRYEGDWVDGKYDGYGVETWARGSRYRGQYRQGSRHGIGVYRFYTGDVYAGYWSNGQCHGCGVHTCQDGSMYRGEFKWGVKHGLGHYHFRNGDRYAGEYFADKMHGFGVYQFGNGHCYEGAWHEGRRQGLGLYTFRNRETQSGHWQNGVLDIPCTLNSHPGSCCTVNYTRVLNAVQEARRAAEKAYNVARVDERVNRTIVAANKAANAARVVAVKAVQNRMHCINVDQ